MASSPAAKGEAADGGVSASDASRREDRLANAGAGVAGPSAAIRCRAGASPAPVIDDALDSSRRSRRRPGFFDNGGSGVERASRARPGRRARHDRRGGFSINPAFIRRAARKSKPDCRLRRLVFHAAAITLRSVLKDTRIPGFRIQAACATDRRTKPPWDDSQSF
jgi:hypothetical protein